MRRPAASGHPGPNDRRFARTRDDLLTAFRALLFARGYEDVTVSQIVERANVGRSTFYEHYDNKDDLFRESLRGIVPVLADAVRPDHDPDRLSFMLYHFWEVRATAVTMLGGSARVVMTGYLAHELEARLERRRARARCESVLPLPMVAAHIAEAQFGLLAAWIGSHGVAAERVAQVLAASSQAIAAANGL